MEIKVVMHIYMHVGKRKTSDNHKHEISMTNNTQIPFCSAEEKSWAKLLALMNMHLVPGHQILYAGLTANVFIKPYVKSNQPGLLSQLNIEAAYDHVHFFSCGQGRNCRILSLV